MSDRARFYILASGLGFLATCGGPPFGVDGEEVAPLRWDTTQQVVRYHVAETFRARVEQDDGTVTGTWRRTELASTVEIGKPEADGRSTVTVTFEGLRGEVEDPATGAFVFDAARVPAPGDRSAQALLVRQLRQAYLEDAYSYTLDPRGEIEVIRAGANALGEPLPDWVGPLPNSALKVGDTWTEAQTVERPPLGELKATTTFTMGDRTRIGPTGCTSFTFETRYSWPDPESPGEGPADPSRFRDEGRVCLGFGGLPLLQVFTATRHGTGPAGEAEIEYTQTRTLIPPQGPVPWTISPPEGPPAPIASEPVKLEVAGPGLPDGARVRLGSARNNFGGRVDLVEPARAGPRVAVAAGPRVTVVDVETGDRQAVFSTPCGAVADLVWTPEDHGLVGLCEPGAEADQAIYVWRAGGTLERTIELPVAPVRLSIARLEGRSTGFAVDVAGGLWRFELDGEAPPQAVALNWPEPEPERTGGDAGPPEDGGLYPEPNDPLLFTRFVVAPDGYQAAGVADGRLVLVDAGAQQVRRVMTDPETVVRDLVWIPGRSGGLVVAVDNRLEIWSADGEAALPGSTVVLDGKAWEGAERLSISADGKRLLSWQANQGTTLWRIIGDKLVAEVLALKAREDAALTAGGRYVVSRSEHASALHAHDLKKNAPTALAGAHGERIVDLATAPDGAHVATADLDGWIQVWAVKGKKVSRVSRFQVQASPQKHGDVVDTFVAFQRDDRLLVGHPLGGGYRRLSGARAQFFEDGFWGIARVLIGDRGRRAVSLHHGYAGVRVWSLEGRDPRELWGERGEPYGVYHGGPHVCGVDLARNGSRLAIQWSDGRVQLRTVDGGAPSLTVQADPTHCRAVLSGDGRRLAYLDADSAAIRVVDLKGRTKATLPGSRAVLYGPLLLDDKGTRVVAGRGRAIWQFELGDKTVTRTFEVPEGEVARLAALGDQAFVSSTALGTSALVWDWPGSETP